MFFETAGINKSTTGDEGRLHPIPALPLDQRPILMLEVTRIMALKVQRRV